MRFNRLAISLLVLVPTLVIADLSITETRTIVCNSNGGQGTVGGSCPIDQSSNPTIVDKIEAAKIKGIGNPINVLTGNKFESATDIQAIGGEYGLSFNRYYNSRSSQRGLLGIGWRHDYEMQLQDIDNQIDIIQADGRQIHFQKSAAALGNSNLFVTRYMADKPELGYIERTQSSDPSKATWLWTLPTGKQLEFVIHKQVDTVNQLGLQRYGQLSRVTEQAADPSSPYWALTYGTDGTLAQVRNHTGDTLKFAYEITASGLPKISVTSSKNKTNNSSNGATDNTGKWVYLLDHNSNLAQVVSPTGVRAGYQYNDPFDKHNLTAKFGYDNKSQAQLITEWQYDAYDRAISSSHKDGIEKVSVVFDKNTVIPTQAGHIFTNTLTNSVGKTTDYRYQYKNGEAQLLSVIGAGCVSCGEPNVSYEYDNAGRVTKTSQLDGQGQAVSSTATEFDNLGRVTKLTQSNSQSDKTAWRSYAYDDSNNLMQPTTISWPSVVDNEISQIKIEYDASGNVIAKTEIGYRPGIPTGTALNTTHKIERTTRFHYTQVNGRDLLSAIDAPQATVTNTSANTDSNDIVQTQYSWDKLGENITKIRYPNHLTEHFSYQTIAGESLLAEHIAPDGVTTTLSYNVRGLPIAIKRGDQKLSVEYDNEQRPIKWQNQLEQTITASYDDSKKQVIYQMHDGQQIVNQYNTEGQLEQYKWLDSKGDVLIDPVVINTVVNAQSLSSSNQLEDQSTFNPSDSLLNADATVEIDIDPLGKIQKIILPEGGIYKRLYDDFGRTIYAEDANTGESIIEYDLNDQPILIQNSTTQQTARYDNSGRLITTKYCKLEPNTPIIESNCESITYTYNAAHLSQIIDPTQTTQYTYDTQGRITVESVHFKDSDKPWQTQYQYDDKGRIDKVGLPEGATLSYVYNDISNPVEVTYQPPAHGWFESFIRKINPDHNSTALISNLESDSARGLLAFTHSNGQTARASYDKAGRLTAWTDGDYQKSLTYDSNHQIIATSSKQKNKKDNQQLKYNAYGELIGVMNSDKSQTTQYQYDRNANRLSLNSPKAQAQYEYKSGTDQLLSITTTTNDNEQKSTYRYDAAGNPTLISVQQRQDRKAQTQRKFTYGARGQLTQIIDDNKQPTQYRYNHAMQRVSKTIASTTKDKHEQRYLWQQGLLDAEIDVKGNQETLTRRYIYIGLRPIAVIDYAPDSNASIYAVHTDHLGTPQQVSNDKQQLVWQGEYDAFGNVTVNPTPQNTRQDIKAKQKGRSLSLMNSANAAKFVINQPFEFNLRFAGQYEDRESGYYYNWHRYYNPETGRYLTSDPIGLNGGLNTYGYAGANPVGAVDPWGLYSIFIGGAGDHEPFVGINGYGVSGPTYNVRSLKDRFIKDFLTSQIKSTGYTAERANYLAKRHARYYGYNQIHLALSQAKMFLIANPKAQINIVGHSLGGWQAAHLAEEVNRYRCGAVANLITLDPVGNSIRIHAAANIKYKVPKPVADTWVNIRAELLGTTSGNNIVADLGGQWEPTSYGQQPDYNYQLNTDHAFAQTMITKNIIAHSFSPWDLLKRYYQKKPLKFNYERVPYVVVHDNVK